jgi:hypothetical protein
MPNGIVLPALNINATSLVSARQPTVGLPMPSPNPQIFMIIKALQRADAFQEGLWREILINHMLDNEMYMKDGRLTIVSGDMHLDLRKIPIVDKFMALHPEASLKEAFGQAYGIFGQNISVADTRELSGGKMSAFAALAHYLTGNGAEVKTDINRIGIAPSTTPIPALENAFNQASIGSTAIKLDKVAYNTMQDSWMTGAWLGNITLKIEGVVHKNTQNTLSFEGKARAYNDLYDANRSTHRGFIPEASTAVLDAMGKHLSARPYVISIQGEIPIVIQRP